MVAPQIDRNEAARREIDHFYRIEHATEPEPGGGAGLRGRNYALGFSGDGATGTTAGVTAHFPAGDGVDPQSRMQ